MMIKDTSGRSGKKIELTTNTVKKCDNNKEPTDNYNQQSQQLKWSTVTLTKFHRNNIKEHP